MRLPLLVAFLALAACSDPPEPNPTPAPSPDPSPEVVPPPPATPAPLLAWRTTLAERESILVALPPYPARLDEVLPEPRDPRFEDARQLVVLAPPETGALLLLRHGPGTATRSLREVLGESAFDRLSTRLGAIDGHPNPTVYATLDVRGAALALGIAELGYRGPGESADEAIREEASDRGLTLVPILDGTAALEWSERMEESDVLGDLLERIELPTRTSAWAEALRSAYEHADATSLATACAEPGRTTTWAEAGRTVARDLAAHILPTVARELEEERSIVALDGCTLVGPTGLVALLRQRGFELVPLFPGEVVVLPPAEGEVVPTEGAPAPTEPVVPGPTEVVVPAPAP